jgi:hypothetical protein
VRAALRSDLHANLLLSRFNEQMPTYVCVCVCVNAEALGPEHWHGVKFSALTGSLPLSLYLALLFLHQLIAVSVLPLFNIWSCRSVLSR